MISPIVVEILGLPGSGKSTVVHRLAARGTITVSTWVDFPRVRWVPVAIQLFLRAPILSALAFLTVATRRNVSRVHLRRVVSIQRRYVMVRVQRREGVVALDEGPVHALFITLYGTRSTAASRLLLRLMVGLLARRIDRFVHLDVPTAQCIENFRRPGRTSARFNDRSSPASIEEFREDGTYDEILDALRRATRGRFVAVHSVGSAYDTICATPVHASSATTAGRGLNRLRR